MILQSVLIPAVMLVEANRDFVSGISTDSGWKTIFELLESLTVILFWATLITTLWSALDYLLAGLRQKKSDPVN